MTDPRALAEPEDGLRNSALFVMTAAQLEAQGMRMDAGVPTGQVAGSIANVAGQFAAVKIRNPSNSGKLLVSPEFRITLSGTTDFYDCIDTFDDTDLATVVRPHYFDRRMKGGPPFIISQTTLAALSTDEAFTQQHTALLTLPWGVKSEDALIVPPGQGVLIQVRVANTIARYRFGIIAVPCGANGGELADMMRRWNNALNGRTLRP